MAVAHKGVVKNLALATLASPQRNARKGAAQIISAIATQELPKNEWPDVISVLSTNAQGTNADYKLASLETLSYIAEELSEKSINEQLVDTILNAVVTNVMAPGDNHEIKLAALTALANCVKLCEKNFRVDHEKEILLSQIFACFSATNSDIRLKAMLCILEIVRWHYDYIGGATLEQLGVATLSVLKNPEAEDVGLIALEVWSSICDEEIERVQKNNLKKPCQNFIQTAYNVLVPLFLECLKTHDDQDEDWTIAISAACCLSQIAEIIKDPITNTVLEYVSKNIGSTDWKCRDAAVLAFAAILKGPSKTLMNSLVEQALSSMLGLLQDTNPRVRETTAWTFGKLAEHTPEPLAKPPAFALLMPALINSLKDSPRVSSRICFALANLAEALSPPEGTTSPMSAVFKNVLQALWDNAFRADACTESNNLAQASFSAFATIVQYSSSDIVGLLEPVLKMLVETLSTTIRGTFGFPAKSNEYQGYLCTALQPVCMKLSGKVPTDAASAMVDCIIESFKIRKTVYDEGITALAGLVSGLGKEVGPHVDRLVPYLLYALKSADDTTLCRAAIGCVGDLSRALEEQTAPYLQQLMGQLMESLSNPQIERNVKLLMINVVGDLSASTNKHFSTYLHAVLEMLKSAATLSLQPAEDVPPSPY